MHDEPFLTIKQVAALLQLSERTVYAMANQGRLPGAVEVGGSWRVMRARLMRWLDAGGDTATPHLNEGV